LFDFCNLSVDALLLGLVSFLGGFKQVGCDPQEPQFSSDIRTKRVTRLDRLVDFSELHLMIVPSHTVHGETAQI
jgi:hypothetical protein